MPLDVLEMIILKASQLLYSVQRASVRPYIDVKKHDVMRSSAEVATCKTLSCVCYGWWKLVSISHWKIRKQLLEARRVVRIVSLYDKV